MNGFADATLQRFVKNRYAHHDGKLSDDPDDDKILECAHAAKADYIVPGDDQRLLRRKGSGVSI
jgi:predicted nucleic acid-binding protein